MTDEIEQFLKEHRETDTILHHGDAYLYWAEGYWLVYSNYSGKKLSQTKYLTHALKILDKHYREKEAGE